MADNYILEKNSELQLENLTGLDTHKALNYINNNYPVINNKIAMKSIVCNLEKNNWTEDNNLIYNLDPDKITDINIAIEPNIIISPVESYRETYNDYEVKCINQKYGKKDGSSEKYYELTFNAVGIPDVDILQVNVLILYIPDNNWNYKEEL